MKLRDVEAKILVAVGVRGDASLRELSRITSMPQHVCRRALDSLFERGALRRRVVIDPGRLGYQIYGLWFSITPRACRVRQRLLSYLVDSPCVAYVGEFEGEFRYKIDIYGRTFLVVSELLGAVTEKFGDVFSKRALSCSLMLGDFALKFLVPEAPQPAGLIIGIPTSPVTIDARDHAILRKLGSQRNESHAALARSLGMAAATFEYRMKRLCSEKVIAGYHALPEVEVMQTLGLLMHIHRLQLNRLDQATRGRILEFAQRDPSVYGFTHSIGACDLELCTATMNIQAEREFGARLETALGDSINEHSSALILKHHKINNYPFGDAHPFG